MALNNTAKNLMLDSLASNLLLLSLHSGDPGATGANNEISGGTPAYARKAITWNSAASGALDSSSQPEFDVPSGVTVAYVGYWSSDGNTFYGSKAVTNETFASQGKYRVGDVDISL